MDRGVDYGSAFAITISEVARALVPRGEIRIWSLEIEGETVAVWIFLVAGGETTAFKTAFDSRWSDC